ncbi:MAG: GDP-mannose 4,6-dehydratase, partial [Gemmataceae bacterium]
DPEAAWEGNLTATRRLFDAVLAWGERPRVLWVGSGLVYGQPADPATPVHEGTELRPDTPYSASKAAADLAAFAAWRAHGLDVVRARPFNHTGPHQSPEFAVPSFARQLVAIERGESPAVLEVGDLSAQRDLSDVRDVAAAYLLLMDRGRAGEAYNVASGVSTPMREVLDRLVALAGLRVEVRTRADLLRPAEQTAVRVDAGKLRRETGWQPCYTLERTLQDTLDAWRRGPEG